MRDRHPDVGIGPAPFPAAGRGEQGGNQQYRRGERFSSSRHSPRTAAVASGRGRRRLRQQEVEPPPHLVDRLELHAKRVAQPIRLAARSAAQAMLLLLVHEEILAQRGDRHQALDEEVFQRHEHSEGGDTRHVRVEIAADLVLHEDDLLPEQALPLRLLGPPLALGADVRRLGEVLVDPLEVLRRHRPPFLEQPRQLAVDDQVRIAADGRGEVAVVGSGERVVAAALLAVDGLALGAQQQVAQEALLGLALDRAEDLLKRRGRDFLEVSLELVAEALQDLAQVDQPVRVGAVVHAVDRRLLGEEQVLRHGFVGREHELLDQLVGDVAGLRDDADHEALVVEHDVGVRQVEVDRAAPLAALAQQRGELPHHLEVVQEGPVAVRVVGGGLRFEQARDLRVGHPMGAPDDAPGELRLEHAPGAVELEEGREHQPVDAGIQRAEPVREALGQHRQDAPGKVDARAPRSGLVV